MAINTDDIEEKLNEVSKEGAEFQTPDDKQLLSHWDQRLKDIKASASFLEHPETLKLLALVESEILRINGRLLHERGMAMLAREALFEARDLCDKMKAFLDRDPEKMMDQLEEDIDSHVWRSGDGEPEEETP